MRYEAPETLDAAVSLLAGMQQGQARILAGGTDLLVQLRAGMIEPDLVVDVKKIPEMHEITAENGGFRIGAAVSGAELGEHPDVKTLWPGVVEARIDRGRLHVTATDAEGVVRRLLAADTALGRLEVRQAGLNEAFNELTREAA